MTLHVELMSIRYYDSITTYQQIEHRLETKPEKQQIHPTGSD